MIVDDLHLGANPMGVSQRTEVVTIVNSETHICLRTGVRITPNPSKNCIYIDSAKIGTIVRLYNHLGQIIDKIICFNSQNIISLRKLTKGTYFMEIIKVPDVSIKKIILE